MGVAAAKTVNIAYPKDEGLTTAFMLDVPATKMTIADRGDVTLTGVTRVMSFRGQPALKEIGIELESVGVGFSNSDSQTFKTSGKAMIDCRVRGTRTGSMPESMVNSI